MRKHNLMGGVAALAILAMPLGMVKANTLTGLIPDLYAGLDVVSRELVGMIPAVTRNFGEERAAVNEAIKWPITPIPAAVSIAPAMTVPEPADQTIGVGSVSITKAKAVPFGWTGEEEKGLNNGPGALSVQADQFAQALRVLVNEVEADLVATAIAAASRAYGTVNTVPFATNLAESAQVRKMLDDNGAPASERSVVINTTVGANLRTLAQLTKANEVGDRMTVRDGQLIDLHGMSYKESGQMGATHTAGTAASATTDNAGYAVGTTTLTLAATGTGTILAGDIITFAGDTNKYVVVTGDADVSNGGTIVIAAPGLRVAMSAAAKAITMIATYGYNVAFPRSAMLLAARLPALPNGGDIATDRRTLIDPRSGLAFEVAMYPGYRKVRYEVALAWGTAAAKSAHIVALIQ